MMYMDVGSGRTGAGGGVRAVARVVSTLEGGYNVVALARCVVEHLEVLASR